MTTKQDDIVECLLVLKDAVDEMEISRDTLETIREEFFHLLLLDVIENAIDEQMNNIMNVVDEMRNLLDDEHTEMFDNEKKGIYDEEKV